jgi:hypothetical protein
VFQFDDLVTAAMSTARRHRLVGILSLALFGSGCVGLVLALGMRYLPLSSRSAGLAQLVILLLVLVVPLVLTLIASRRAFPASEVLFALDCKLDLEARISSLHVLSATNPSSVFYDRLEQTVAQGSEGWRRVYRLSVRTWSQLAIGLACALSIAALIAVGKGTPQPAPTISSDVAGSPAVEAIDSGDDEIQLEDELSTVEMSEDWIARALEELLAAHDSGESPQQDVPDDFDAAAVESYTAALLDSLREAGDRPLSDAELDRLSALAEKAPTDLRGALEAILVEDDPEEIQDQLDLISEYARQQAQLDMMLAEEEGAPPDEASGYVPQEGPGADDEGGTYPMSGFEDDGDRTPSIVEAPLPGEIGEAGAVYEYITGGVPIELPTDGRVPDEDAQLTVDYARVQTILDTRALPQDAFETVRRYFELISSGGDP